jgi:hypothetical protein
VIRHIAFGMNEATRSYLFVNVFLKIVPSFMMTTKFLVGSSRSLMLAIG